MKRCRKARKDNEPSRLPRRRRALSASPPPRRFFVRSKVPQQSSSLPPLLALPFEIRRRIFIALVGGSVVHLVQLPKRLGHVRCGYDAPGSIGHDMDRNCIPYGERKNYFIEEWPVSEAEAKSDDGGLALLRTCRQVYRECIELLYETNVFDVNHPQTLAFLGRTIRPNRLTAIRSLQLTWKRAGYSADPNPAHLEAKEPDSSMNPDRIHTWWWACKIITEQMTGLRILKVKLIMGNSHLYRSDNHAKWKEHSELILQPLQKMKGLKEFDVQVYPWDD